jgi:hypothetical protein
MKSANLNSGPILSKVEMMLLLRVKKKKEKMPTIICIGRLTSALSIILIVLGPLKTVLESVRMNIPFIVFLRLHLFDSIAVLPFFATTAAVQQHRIAVTQSFASIPGKFGKIRLRTGNGIMILSWYGFANQLQLSSPTWTQFATLSRPLYLSNTDV